MVKSVAAVLVGLILGMAAPILIFGYLVLGASFIDIFTSGRG